MPDIRAVTIRYATKLFTIKSHIALNVLYLFYLRITAAFVKAALEREPRLSRLPLNYSNGVVDISSNILFVKSISEFNIHGPRASSVKATIITLGAKVSVCS